MTTKSQELAVSFSKMVAHHNLAIVLSLPGCGHYNSLLSGYAYAAVQSQYSPLWLSVCIHSVCVMASVLALLSSVGCVFPWFQEDDWWSCVFISDETHLRRLGLGGYKSDRQNPLTLFP